MQKTLLATGLVAALTSFSANASSFDGVGMGINYGAFAGPTLELSYPISDTLQLRGALSGGMGLSETTSDTDIDYDVEADGGIHRLALDYHPFGNGFFLSAGYAVNNFELNVNGAGTGTTEIGFVEFNADITIDGNAAWSNAPTLSLGWGHSPQEGLGFMFEIGAFFTGSADVKLDGTCTGTCTDPVSGETFEDALKDEEKKLQDDVADFNLLPMISAGITYRF